MYVPGLLDESWDEIDICSLPAPWKPFQTTSKWCVWNLSIQVFTSPSIHKVSRTLCEADYFVMSSNFFIATLGHTFLWWFPELKWDLLRPVEIMSSETLILINFKAYLSVLLCGGAPDDSTPCPQKHRIQGWDERKIAACQLQGALSWNYAILLSLLRLSRWPQPSARLALIPTHISCFHKQIIPDELPGHTAIIKDTSLLYFKNLRRPIVLDNGWKAYVHRTRMELQSSDFILYGS